MYRFLGNIKISYRLAVGYSLLFFFTVGIAGGIIYSLIHGAIKRNIESELQVTTRTVVNMVQTAADVSIKNRLRAIAEKNLEIISTIHRQYELGQIDLPTAKSRAGDILLGQTIGNTGYIYCLYSSGVIALHPVTELLGADVSNRGFVQQQLDTREGYLEYHWQNPGEDHPRPKALYMIYFEPWDWIISVSSYRSEFTSLVDADDFRDSVGEIHFGESGYTFITDGEGQAVIHPFVDTNLLENADPERAAFVQEVLDEKSGILFYSWQNPGEPEPRDKVVVFRHLPDFDWIVGSSSYLDEVYAPLGNIKWLILGTGVLTLILVLPLSLILGKSITRPLQKLMHDFDVAAEGDLGVRSDLRSRDEVGLLAAQFNAFMGRLQLSRAALQNETETRQQEEYQRKLFEEVFESALEGIVITDDHGRIVAVNPAFTQITGYEPHEVIGENPRVLKSDRHDAEFYKDMWQSLREKGRWSGEVWNRRKSGESYPELLCISSIRDVDGTVTHYVSVFHDITDMKLKEEQIHFQSYHDALTGLPNRILLNDRLTVAIAHAAWQGKRVAILYIDLDNFKHINDSLGHAKGDLVLQEVAVRLSETMNEQATVARLGGDEFVIMLEGDVDARAMVHQANRVLSLFQKPFSVEGEEFFITSSIGMTMYPDDGGDAGTLVKNADMAMFQAKDGGKNSYHLFTPEMNEKVNRRLKMESNMRKGLRRDEFMVYYQPKIDLKRQCVVGMEALVRWIRLDGSIMSPAEFIPLAEETGLIIEIGERVLDKACAFLRLLDETEFTGLSMAVNLSPEQFRQEDLVDMISRTLEIHGVPPQRLELEITESTIMRDVDETIRKLNELVTMGVSISIDDFGTGYSSLYYLKNFPIDTLKIDRSFVRNLCDDPSDAQIVQTITLMARNLGIGVVAEGVEDREQEELLIQFECGLAQGFLYSKPLPGPDFESFLKRFSAAECTE